MHNIRYFRNSDARCLAKMLGDEWDLAKRTTGAGRLCDWIYLAEILAENTDMLVFTNDKGRPVGFAGYSWHGSRKNMLRRMAWRFTHFVLCMCVKNRDALRKYYDAYDYAPRRIVNMFDVQCDILIVDKNYRGGAGRTLFVALMRHAGKCGIKKIRIDTDDSCNVEFYRRLGATQVYHRAAKHGGEKRTANVYVFCAEPYKFMATK